MFAVGDRKQSDLLASRAPIPTSSSAGADRCATRVDGGRRNGGATSSSTSRSARPRRCWRWSMRCSPIREAAAGVVVPGAGPAPRAGPRRPRRVAVELWPLAPPPDDAPSRAVDACRRSNLGSSARRSVLAEALADWIARETGGGDDAARARGRPLRAGRRAGAGAPPQRLRPRAGAGAEGARGAGRRARPARAHRPAGGRRPAGAVRRAAAARGRPGARLRADQPARRPLPTTR